MLCSGKTKTIARGAQGVLKGMLIVFVAAFPSGPSRACPQHVTCNPSHRTGKHCPPPAAVVRTNHIFVGPRSAVQTGQTIPPTLVVDDQAIPPFSSGVVQKSAVIPYVQAGNNQPLVHAQFDKHYGGDFIMDTGSSISVISDKLVAKLRLPTEPFLEDGKPVIYNGQLGRSVTITSVRMGGLEIQKMKFIVLNSDNVAAALPIDGVIGGQELTPFTVLFDHDALQIKIWTPAGVTPDLLKSEGFDPAAFVPIAKCPPGFPYTTRVTFQNGDIVASEDMVIDTGAEETQVSPELVAKLKLVPFEQRKHTSPFGPPVEHAVAHVFTLFVGNQIETKADVHYTSLPAPHTAVSKLGMDVLGGYRMLFDYPNNRLYLNPWIVVHRQPAKVVPPDTPTPDAGASGTASSDVPPVAAPVSQK